MITVFIKPHTNSLERQRNCFLIERNRFMENVFGEFVWYKTVVCKQFYNNNIRILRLLSVYFKILFVSSRERLQEKYFVFVHGNRDLLKGGNT